MDGAWKEWIGLSRDSIDQVKVNFFFSFSFFSVTCQRLSVKITLSDNYTWKVSVKLVLSQERNNEGKDRNR